MLQMMCEIAIGNLPTFKLTSGVSIRTSWKEQTDTCTIELPRKIKSYEGKRMDDVIKRGMEVRVLLGYDNKLNEEFVGYVTSVKPTYPVQIECEDKMWLLKKLPVKPKSFEDATVKDVLNYINVKQHMDYKVLGDVQLGAYQITPEYDTAAKVLKKLKDDYPVLMSFIRGGVLCVGDPYDATYAKEVRFSFGLNIISHELEYRKADEISYRVKMTSKNDDGKETVVYVGDTDGDQRTFTELNKTEAQLKELGQRYLEQLKYDGFRGKFTGFGVPLCRHGYIANITDSEEKERDGKYYIDAIDKTFDMGGFRQMVELGKKAA
jgi:hypothetical protein